jgi:Fur family ferric uptake transcriptional regulator
MWTLRYIVANYCKNKELQMTCGKILEAKLRKKGFRVTPQRSVILETIAHKGGHISVHEVYLEARERLPGLNVATIYRTLDTLQQAGMIDMLASDSGVARFSLRDERNPHGHLVCRNCNQILEVSTDLIARSVQNLERDTGFVVDVDHLTLFGLCRSCAAADESSSRK